MRGVVVCCVRVYRTTPQQSVSSVAFISAAAYSIASLVLFYENRARNRSVGGHRHGVILSPEYRCDAREKYKESQGKEFGHGEPTEGRGGYPVPLQLGR